MFELTLSNDLANSYYGKLENLVKQFNEKAETTTKSTNIAN